MSKAYQVITDQIIELLEQGTVPWRQPWISVAPQNLITCRAYRGINPFILACRGFSSPFWLTFRQAKQLGGSVRKGQRSAPVVFWKIHKKEDEESQEEAQTVSVPVLRYYRVFNVEQCEGLPEERIPVIEEREFAPLEIAEKIVAGMPGPPEIRHGATAALYLPAKDRVELPRPTCFESSHQYYCTLFHELTHASGSKGRLGRLGGKTPAPFGSADYSREELVAEMGAAFLCGECGIEQSTLENSAAYISHWLQRLKSDPRLAVIAAAQAQKAADFILGRHQPNGKEKAQATAKAV
ncbi:MAG TPA: ArdC-like ssDNA-binding domain-containing protein [Acidobacteriota bacterium]|nr:ArdC-like ssDNA-binding domain-containing protein [Acidobacteriota bacterium]